MPKMWLVKRRLRQHSLKIDYMKRILFGLLLLLVGCAPVRYVYIDPKDSIVKKQRVYYDDIYYSTPLYYPFYWNYSPGIRFTQPIIINPRPRVVIPSPKISNPPQRPSFPSQNNQRAPIRRFNNK